MFTGIVQPGRVIGIEARGAAARLEVAADWLAGAVAVGDSVAVNGCCLTAVHIASERVAFDCVRETLERTSLGELAPGRRVNLELALRGADRLGGHFVTGHIDGTGRVAALVEEPGQTRLVVECAPALTAALVPKGSVALDGVSLTLVEVDPGRLSVALIPHTLAITTLGEARPGQRLNVETDLLGKYVAQAVARYLGRDSPLGAAEL